jgi:hypothetical protein
MQQLAQWLLRHLLDPALLLWVVKHGGHLHDEFRWLVERRLEELNTASAPGNKISSNPTALGSRAVMPSLLMRTLWRMMLTGRVYASRREHGLHAWVVQFKRDGLTPSLRIMLRELLAPRVRLREPMRWTEHEPVDTAAPARLKDLVDWEIVLVSEHADALLGDRLVTDLWRSILPRLLPDFTTLLRDALDLMSELGGASRTSDLSYLHQPSITPHQQNRRFHEWTFLIELVREAWVAAASDDAESAHIVASGWQEVHYPIFRRLALFAGTHAVAVPASVALGWLLADQRWWLWSVESQREAMRLIVSLAPRLDAAQLFELEAAILLGPPRTMFSADVEPERWGGLVDRSVWLRLEKLVAGGAKLSSSAESALNTILSRHPAWSLAETDRDEFPTWMESGWVGDRDPWLAYVATPRLRSQLRDYLVNNAVLDVSKQDDWAQRCRDSFQATTYALCHLTKSGLWPLSRWRDALQAWSDDRLHALSWRWMAPVLAQAPRAVLGELAQGVSWWLRAIAKTFVSHEATFFDLCSRILAGDEALRPDTDDPVGQAINHPVGHVTDALLRWWYRRDPEDEQGLPAKPPASE